MTDHVFPHLSNEDYTKDGEPMYGGSIGMNKVYDRLVKTASDKDAHPFRVIIVNALTLIRNNYDPNFHRTQVNAQKDIGTLITYLSIYLRNTQPDLDQRRMSIIFLYPDYSAIPKTLRREPTAQFKRILGHYTRDAKDVSTGLKNQFRNDVLQIFSFKAGDRTHYPHLELRKKIFSEIDEDKKGRAHIPYRLGEPIHLLSHIALDWHLVDAFPNLTLIESFTGEMITPPYFGSKLIKKKGIKVPFSSVIHQTFGDDTLIKPLAVRKTKNNLLASAEKWSMMSSAKINKVISDTLDLSLASLTKYNFTRQM